MANVVQNPSFETLVNNMPQYWNTALWGAGTITPANPFMVDETRFYDGQRSMRTTIETMIGFKQAVIYQILNPTKFIAGKTYPVRIPIYGTAPSQLFISFGLNNQEVGYAFIDVPNSPDNWLVYESTITVPNVEFNQVQLYLVVQSVGIVNFDGVYIEGDTVLPQFTLTYQSNPIAVPCAVNGQTLNSGGGIQVPSGTSVTISVPSEVNV